MDEAIKSWAFGNYDELERISITLSRSFSGLKEEPSEITTMQGENQAMAAKRVMFTSQSDQCSVNWSHSTAQWSQRHRGKDKTYMENRGYSMDRDGVFGELGAGSEPPTTRTSSSSAGVEIHRRGHSRHSGRGWRCCCEGSAWMMRRMR